MCQLLGNEEILIKNQGVRGMLKCPNFSDNFWEIQLMQFRFLQDYNKQNVKLDGIFLLVGFWALCVLLLQLQALVTALTGGFHFIEP